MYVRIGYGYGTIPPAPRSTLGALIRVGVLPKSAYVRNTGPGDPPTHPYRNALLHYDLMSALTHPPPKIVIVMQWEPYVLPNIIITCQGC